MSVVTLHRHKISVTTLAASDLSCSQKLCPLPKNLNCRVQWSRKGDRGFSVWVSWKSVNWDAGQGMLPTLFVMLGGDLTEWKGPWGPGRESKELSSQFRVLINSHQEQTSWLCSESFPV